MMYPCLRVPCSVVLVITFINIVVQGYNFGAMTNDHLQGVSLKVLEHDEEHEQVHDTYLVLCVVCN